MSKISIIGGAGTLGTAIAYQLSNHQNIDEICLIDKNRNLLLNHVMDFQNAFPAKKIYEGTYNDLKRSDIIIITAGIPNRNDITSRNVFLEGNLKLFHDLGAEIKKHAPDALIVTASNPVDLLNYYLYRKFGFRKQQLIGFTRNDSLRFEWAIRKTMQLSARDQVFSPVIGEHGESQVLLFSHLKINGLPIKMSMDQIGQIKEQIQGWFIQFNQLNINRTTGWTTANGMGELVTKLLDPTPSEFIGSAVLEGEYGVSDVSIGVPITISNEGIHGVQEWDLNVVERGFFQNSVNQVKDYMKSPVFI
ncbi:malate dehydrogenase [Niallia endozanthoxylica]|uniref:malate dehydrogenase n=1 Tax=Niallia endozanthoxylica TaxID=2036016 RepID=UPI00168AC37E|nr:hypothetical protein [Niallia endozanthoxylica]